MEAHKPSVPTAITSYVCTSRWVHAGRRGGLADQVWSLDELVRKVVKLVAALSPSRPYRLPISNNAPIPIPAFHPLT